MEVGKSREDKYALFWERVEERVNKVLQVCLPCNGPGFPGSTTSILITWKLLFNAGVMFVVW